MATNQTLSELMEQEILVSTFREAANNAEQVGCEVGTVCLPPQVLHSVAEALAKSPEPQQIVCVVPVGWKLVPEIPTNAMCEAGAEQNTDADQEGVIYAAMIAYAPKPQMPTQSGEDLRWLMRQVQEACVGIEKGVEASIAKSGLDGAYARGAAHACELIRATVHKDTRARLQATAASVGVNP